MKNRLRSWTTTIIGALLMLAAGYLWFGNKLGWTEHETNYIELSAVVALGYVFLMAKDTLIEGLFMGIFKIKPKEEKDKEEE